MYSITNNLGYAVGQLAEAPRYKPEGRGFTENFIYLIFPAAQWDQLSL
jgi:hypothetical protein